jgi:hypothetical protein
MAGPLYAVPRPPGPALAPLPRLITPQVTGTLSGPNNGGSATGAGWVNPGNAAGGDDNTYAVWTVP